MKKEELVRKWAISLQEGVEKHEKIPLWQAEMTIQQILKEAEDQIGASVTEEWIDKKAGELAEVILRIVLIHQQKGTPTEAVNEAKDFIRKLVKDISNG